MRCSVVYQYSVVTLFENRTWKYVDIEGYNQQHLKSLYFCLKAFYSSGR